MMLFWSPKLFVLSKIGVLGCGWLGFPLAVSLIKSGYTVHGSTTSKEKLVDLKKRQIEPFLISLNEHSLYGSFFDFLQDVETLIINVPPKLRIEKKGSYVKKMQLLHQEVKKSAVRKIVFISSTSVYGDEEGEVTEETVPEPLSESGKQLLCAENIFKNDANLQTTIIRFGGLIGPGRHPVTVLSGKKNLPNGNAPVNLVHLDDCIGIITAVISNSWWGETMNGVYPEHPSKQKYYTSQSLKRGIEAPVFIPNNFNIGKIVRSRVLINVKKFRFTTTL